MKRIFVLLTFAFVFTAASLPFTATPVVAQSLENDLSPETPAKRYFLSTNMLNWPLLMPNVGFEVRFPDQALALKTNLFGGLPWMFGGLTDSERVAYTGLHIEPRGYVNKTRTLYFGPAINLILANAFGKGEELDYKPGYDGNGPWRHTGIQFYMGVNAVAGFYKRVTTRFGVDFNIGFGGLFVITSTHPLPFGQAGITLSWELGRNIPPLP